MIKSGEHLSYFDYDFTMSISDKTRKMLWARSGGKCAICGVDLVSESSDADKEAIIGDECHIVAQKDDGPRGKANLTVDERDELNNLILLCKNHHKLVDDQPNEYTVEKLTVIKLGYEKWVRETLSSQSKKGPKKDDVIISQRLETGQKLVQVFDGCHLHYLNNDNLQNEDEVEVVGDFLQNLEDYMNIWCDLDAKSQIQAQFELDREIRTLEMMGFLVYGSHRPERWKFGDFTDDFLTVYIFVFRKSNPLVQRNEKIDNILGVDKLYPSEYAPFILSIRQ